MPSTVFWLIAFPFLGSLILGILVLLRVRLSPAVAGIIACGASGLSFTRAFSLAMDTLAESPLPDIVLHLGSWIEVTGLAVPMSFRVDALSAVMALVVTGVGFLIHVYSVGYMAHDEGIGRFFAYLNLFCGFMLVLVTATSLPLLFVGWEGVGLCSYLLIGFWFSERKNTAAGTKAFVVNRIGDAGFLLGIFLAYHMFATLDIAAIQHHGSLGEFKETMHLELLALLLFIGCVGKSAQFPLYIWLPDAMAGPTPVSALIHAATMVTAGVYLLARMSFLYALAPVASEVVAVTGAFTALIAATMAWAQTDIKKVLAFSTVSQLGFMVLAMGVGSTGAGIFHLVTHAFFKALLFLAAGSVIHALHGEQDIRQMGGLKTYLISTAIVFAVGFLAIAGFPGFSGWFSKDEILVGVLATGHLTLFWMALAAAVLTVIYMTRLFCLVFLGIPKIPTQNLRTIHESPRSMTLPMYLLAFLSIFGGTGLFPFHRITLRLFPVAGEAPLPFDLTEGKFAFYVTLLVLAVLVLVFKTYVSWDAKLERHRIRVERLAEFTERQYRFDDLASFVGSALSRRLAAVARLVDYSVVDDFFYRFARYVRGLGGAVARLQNGYVQVYALGMGLGCVLLIYLLFRGGA
ncbi:MAG TPA: NADH-quinone oxidoreductase subunit L [Bdellovibrionota bacterium]|nr:NADH-quinone oxidoreductase subunit L [Bdellovibrionota bacterium]